MRMRSIQGKKLLSFLRGGDYAHPGEEEAILKVFSSVSKNPDRLVLDVGCGLGCTAKFVQDHGFGKVVGIDIEKDSIAYAKQNYPSVEFYASNVTTCDSILAPRLFDLIYLFNSFYSFNNQLAALKTLSQIANPKAKLLIFDYTDLSEGTCSLIRKEFNNVSLPIQAKSFTSFAQGAGWRVEKIENLDGDYLRWYSDLLDRIVKKRKFVLQNFGEEGYNSAFERYTAIYRGLAEKAIGGGIFELVKINCLKPGVFSHD